MKNLLFPTILLISCASHRSDGAILLSGSYSTAGATFALPTGENTDWAYWNTTPPGPTNTSSSGNRTFTVSTVGSATSLLGSSSTASSKFTYTNGENPTSSASAFAVGGIRNNLVGAGAIGSGIQMTLGSFTGTSLIQLWTYNYMAGATMNVFLNDSTVPAYTGVIPFIPTADGPSSTGKNGYLFTFEFQPETETDTIRFEYVLHEQSTAGSQAQRDVANVGFQAVAISPIPEPASLTLLGAAAGLGLLRRRRC